MEALKTVDRDILSEYIQLQQQAGNEVKISPTFLDRYTHEHDDFFSVLNKFRADKSVKIPGIEQ